MKKILLTLAVALSTMAINAQSVQISTFNGTNVSQYAGELKDVCATRVMFQGWNTISLPFAMTEEQLNEAFGQDCRLEKLEGVSQDGANIYLNFANVKAEGIQANTPYLLYYTKENANVKINVKNARLESNDSEISFTTPQGATVTMTGAGMAKDGAGLYGIRAIDNKEAKFVDVTDMASKFYATRCYLEITGATNVNLIATHGEKGATGINATAANATDAAAFDMNGRRVNINAKGVKVVNGKKQF